MLPLFLSTPTAALGAGTLHLETGDTGLILPEFHLGTMIIPGNRSHILSSHLSKLSEKLVRCGRKRAVLSVVDHTPFACQPSRLSLASHRGSNRGWLGPTPLLPPSFLTSILLKMNSGFPSVRIACTDKGPSQEESSIAVSPCRS